MRLGGHSGTIISDGGNVFTTEYHDESPVQGVIRGISTLEGCTVEEAPTLYDYVDPDAMNQMMERARDRGQEVTLQVIVEDYKVSVDSDGTISIRDPVPDTDSSDSE